MLAVRPEIKEPVARPKSSFYRPELDALRFFAFLMVFCCHCPIKRMGWFMDVRSAGAFGVCMFFCLSAYLIVTLLLREREASGTIQLRAFAIRRVLRIAPLYFLLILIGWTIGVHWPEVRIEHHLILAFGLMYANLYIGHYGVWTRAGTLAALWSLSVEEQFYLVAPFLVRLGGRRAVAILSAATVIMAYATLYWFWQRPGSSEQGIWCNSPVQFQFFAAGALIALILYGKTLRVGMAVRAITLASGCALIWVAVVLCRIPEGLPAVSLPQLFGGYMAALAGITALFCSVVDFPRRIPRPLAYLGKISYGLYMFHEVLLWLANKRFGIYDRLPVREQIPAYLAVLVLTIAVAAVSYRFFEKPILRLKQRFEVVKTRAA